VGAYYFLGNQLLGTSLKPPMWSDEAVQECNVAFMCRTCGDVWARITNTTRSDWTFLMRACSKHGDGSFIAAWSNKFDELPPEVLHYELLLLLAKEP
jgi:hypothetical protein